MTTHSSPLVWLPFDPEPVGALVPGLRYVVGDPCTDRPSEIADVEILFMHNPVGVPLAELVPQMPQLRAVQTLSAGVNGIAAQLRPGISLHNGKGIHDTATAELAVALTLAARRGIPEFVGNQGLGAWGGAAVGTQVPPTYPGLADQTVLILGYGTIGQAIERRLDGFEAEIVRVARSAHDGVHSFDELDELLPTADIVILIVPLTDETHGMVDAKFLFKMKDGALLVNVARGPVVVTEDLIDACASGRIQAALDVTAPEPLPRDHPLWSTPGVLVTPHVGGLSGAMHPRINAFLREQLARIVAGEPMTNEIRGAY